MFTNIRSRTCAWSWTVRKCTMWAMNAPYQGVGPRVPQFFGTRYPRPYTDDTQQLSYDMGWEPPARRTLRVCNFATFKLCGKFVSSVLLNVLCPRVVHICSSTAIVNRLRFHSCGSVVSTSVAQLTKMCRPVGCRPVGLSSTRLSPRNGDQSLHDDQTRWEGIFTRSIMSVAVAKIFYDTNNNDNRSFGIMVSPRPRLNH